MPEDTFDQLQRLLDAIGQEPGSILIRGADRWIALPPGEVGDVLTINDGGMPAWVAPGTVQFA